MLRSMGRPEASRRKPLTRAGAPAFGIGAKSSSPGRGARTTTICFIDFSATSGCDRRTMSVRVFFFIDDIVQAFAKLWLAHTGSLEPGRTRTSPTPIKMS
jgi:hypothetical protein